MRRRTEQDESGDVLLDVVGDQSVAATTDEVLDDGVDRPRRRWPFALAVVATAVAVVVAVAHEGGRSAPSADTSLKANHSPAVPRNLPWPEGGFTADAPGECPSKVVCAVAETPSQVRTSIRKAVVKHLGAAEEFRVVTRVRPATVSDYQSMYTRVITARVPGARLKVVVSRSPIDPTSDSVLAGGRADVRYESELAGYQVVGVLGVPGTLSRRVFLGLTGLVDDRVLVAGRT